MSFKYEDDQLFVAKKYKNTKYDKCVAVVHFSWTSTLDQLTRYFSQTIESTRYANSTWGVGKDGTVHRYLPEPELVAWTQGLHAWDQGGFIDHNGAWVKNVNNIACSFEIANINKEPYTEAQYEAVAKRILWMNEYFPNFRMWLTTGHEQITPLQKDDPGPQFDWEKLLVGYCKVRKDFYDEYLRYLAETSAYGTVRDKSRSDRKWAQVRDGVEKIRGALIGKEKGFCF